MILKKLSAEKLTNIKYLIEVLEQERIFFPDRPLQEIEFPIKRISIFQMAHNNSGFPFDRTTAKYYFNYKDLFEILHKEGYLTINEEFRYLRFLGWKIKTNYQTLLDLKVEINKKLDINYKQKRENIVEVLVRDAIRNNPTLVFPSKTSQGIKFPKNVSIKKETLNCGECDIVCRLNDEVVLIAEITSSAINNDYTERRIPKRRIEAPNAKIWIIGSRIGDNILRNLQKLNVDVTTFEQLKKSIKKYLISYK